MKTGSVQQKFHQACFVPFSDTHNDSKTFRQYVLLPPQPFSQIRQTKAIFLPSVQRYQQRDMTLDIYGNSKFSSNSPKTQPNPLAFPTSI